MANWSWVLSAAINLVLIGLIGIPVVERDPVEDEPDFRCSFREPSLDLTLTRPHPDHRIWEPLSPGEKSPAYRGVFYVERDGSYCRYCWKGLEDYCDGKVQVYWTPDRP